MAKVVDLPSKPRCTWRRRLSLLIAHTGTSVELCDTARAQAAVRFMIGGRSEDSDRGLSSTFLATIDRYPPPPCLLDASWM